VDPNGGGRDDDAPELITWNRWYELRAHDGYGIWRRGAPPDARPLARFDEDEAGFDAAEREFRRRSKELRLFYQTPIVLAWVVGIGAVVYVVLLGWQTAAYLALTNSQTGDGPPFWVEAAAQFAYAVWLAALGVMAMLWLVRRAHQERGDG
jgi:hypothetical protein